MVEICFKTIPTEEELKKFYAGRKWRKFRKLALKRDNFECQRCKKLGFVVKAECVHHKGEKGLVILQKSKKIAFILMAVSRGEVNQKRNFDLFL